MNRFVKLRPSRLDRAWFAASWILAFAFSAAGAGAGAVRAADLAEAQRLHRVGEYDPCAQAIAEAIRSGAAGWEEGWHHLRIRTELARGRSRPAFDAIDEALKRFSSSIALRLLAHETYRSHGRAQEAAKQLDEIEQLLRLGTRRYANAEGWTALGRYFLLRGADPKKVLDQFFDVAVKQRPDYSETYFAIAEMALDKQDDALAAETLAKAPKTTADDPRYHWLLARAFAESDRAKTSEALDRALKINPRHVESLLLLCDGLIDSERYVEAKAALDRVAAVNPNEPRAWSYRAVLAHLANDAAGEAQARKSALAVWAKNPDVDSLIGRELSQKYRFAEGAASQRRALAFDPDDLPAKIQLCQDLLRLGDEAAGWKLAEEVFAKDPYHIVAYNLITLKERLDSFRTIAADGLVLKMDPREADLYGPRVLALLKEAKAVLAEKYGATLPNPVTVEIFPQRKEFAVRTFGLPGADGLLGVCFGNVVTALSPVSQGEEPSNWEAVLWHEFCHVATLSKTKNKMPRWLSEGISVFEESQRDPSWADPMNPRFREMILGKALIPISRLSSAFLEAKTALDIQFAYYESSLAVEFLAKRSGLAAIKGLLDDLGNGIAINESLPRRTQLTLEQLDGEFIAYARDRAAKVAPTATWDEPGLTIDADSAAIRAWLTQHPNSFPGWRRLASRLSTEEKWSEARDALLTLKRLYPEYNGPENARAGLALAYRKLNDLKAERAVLEESVAIDGDAFKACLRLIELDEADRNWASLAKHARRLMAIHPLIPAPHRALAKASEALGDRDEAIRCYQALAVIDDADPAEIHYRLASLLKQAGRTEDARRETLKALEEAPRFLEAHRLLLELRSVK